MASPCNMPMLSGLLGDKESSCKELRKGQKCVLVVYFWDTWQNFIIFCRFTRQ